MDLGSILFLSGIVVLAAVIISQPFTKHNSTQTFTNEQQLSPLLAEQEHVINALLELDFDYNLGKIPAEDYPTQRNALLMQGAHIMKQLDNLQAEKDSDVEAPKLEKPDRGQQAKASNTTPRKERIVKRPLTTPDDDLEVLLAARRRERNEKAGGFCPQCGSPIQQSDRFCSRCGEALLSVDNKQ